MLTVTSPVPTPEPVVLFTLSRPDDAGAAVVGVVPVTASVPPPSFVRMPLPLPLITPLRVPSIEAVSVEHFYLRARR